MLPDGNALDLLPRLKEIDPSVPVIVLTGHGTIDLAVRAIKEGAEQFLTKPVELPALLVVLERLLENQRGSGGRSPGRARQARETRRPVPGTCARHPRAGRAGAAARRVEQPDPDPGRDRHRQGRPRPLAAPQRPARATSRSST